MKKLYSAQVARPLSATNTRPTRLGFATTAWCRYEDLVAVISGCGAVAVFHADAPGEATLLVGEKRAPARHVIWRNAPNKPAMLVVADAAGRITFWLARDRRVNVWSSFATVELTSVAVAVGWNNPCTALAVVLANGGLSVYSVRDEPVDNVRRRSHQKSRDPSRRYPTDPKYGAGLVKLIPCNQKLPEMFGGQLRCATVAPGHINPTSVALATVSAAQPRKLNVWQVSISKTGNPICEVKPMSSTEMDPVEDGRCVACAVVPKLGMLFAIGDRGVIAHWSWKKERGESGWTLQQKTRIDQAAEDAASRGVIPKVDDNQNAMVNAITRGLQVSRKRKVYAFEVSFDSKTIVMSTSTGLFVWDVDVKELRIVQGHQLKPVDDAEGSPYWGLCISPAGAAVMALNGQGRLDTYSLISPLTQGSPEAVSTAATSIARRLVATTYSDGLRGGWDLIAAVAREGPAAASMVAKALTQSNVRNVQDPPVSSDKLVNLKSLMMRIVNVQDSTAHAARRLLEVAIDAIRQSAPNFVKLKLMDGAKEASQLTSVDHIQKMIEQGLATTRPSIQELAAAPLADWIMVLCAVWLQRCAAAVARHDSKVQLGSAWANLASLATSGSANVYGKGMVGDPMLIHNLRPAAVAAVVLAAFDDEHGEPDADPRYYRFPRERSAQIIAALWEVSLAWNSGEAAPRPMANGTLPQGTPSEQGEEHVRNTILSFRKHEPAAHAIAATDKLRVDAAEKALGLHGSAIGAGFIMSCTRKPSSSVEASDKKEPEKWDESPPKTEWCPFDVVTGRPLPPWAPLRRCIASGLLAAEITQQKSDSAASVSSVSPWISKWANESPFGGRWARVPSLDLDRYELLPSVLVHSADRMDNTGNNAVARHTKSEHVLHRQGLLAGGVAQARASMQRPVTMANQPYSLNAAANAEAAVLATAGAGNPMSQMVGNPNAALQQAMPGMPANVVLQGALGRMHPGTGRIQASPRMSTASSTTDAGSSISKAARKRASSQKGRARKRAATEPRTPTASQLSDLTRNMGMNGMQSAASPTQYGRAASAADAMSTDTRSTMTTATNATGGVDQDTSKPGRKSRKRSSKAKQHPMDVAVENAAAAAASAAGGMPPAVAGTLPPGIPPSLNQSSPASHATQTPRTASQTKKKPVRGTQRSHATAAAHAAAAHAAAAAAAGVSANKQSPMARNSALLHGALPPDVLGADGMNKAVDAMSPLGFVPGNPAINAASNAIPRRANMAPGGNAALLSNGQAANLALNGLLQQGNFGLQGIPDGSMTGSNGQAPTDATGMQQMAGANAATVAGEGGVPPVVSIALKFGVPPHQFTGFTREKLQQTYQALSRRMAIQNAVMGGNVRGTPPNAVNNPNLLAKMSAALTATDMSNNPLATGMGHMGPAAAGASLKGTMPQTGSGVVNGAAGMGSMGLPMNTPRSGTTESQTSARVASGSMNRAGIPTPSTQMGVERDSASAAGMINGASPLGMSGVRTSGAATGPSDRERRIVWKGDLHVEGHSLDMLLSFVAIQHDLKDRARIRDTSGWPRQFELNSSKLMAHTQVSSSLYARESQWYVRFVPVDKNGQEIANDKVTELVGVMQQKKLSFALTCNEGVGTPGTLFVWGMDHPDCGSSLLGVFRPDEPQPPALADDQDMSLVL